MQHKILLLFLLVSICLKGQSISTSSAFNASQLANFFAGPNVSVSNASMSGSSASMGLVIGSGTDFPFYTSVILSTGLIVSAAGPNNSPNTGIDLQLPGNSELSINGGATSYDAVLLEFDITVPSTAIALNYIFASEEYPEYVGSNFADSFAILISGSGINGQENIALIPNSILPFSINNISPITNSQYYVDNTNGTAVEFDGYTTVLKAKKIGLTPNQNYHIKIILADFSDHIFDSALFFETGSLIQGSDAEILGLDQSLIRENELFTIFPNPTSGFFSVKSPTLTKIPYQMLVYDAIGNVVGSKSIKSTDDLFIDGSLLQAGVYFVKLVGETIDQTEKLLILK
jgi:hypothetical protein